MEQNSVSTFRNPRPAAQRGDCLAPEFNQIAFGDSQIGREPGWDCDTPTGAVNIIFIGYFERYSFPRSRQSLTFLLSCSSIDSAVSAKNNAVAGRGLLRAQILKANIVYDQRGITRQRVTKPAAASRFFTDNIASTERKA